MKCQECAFWTQIPESNFGKCQSPKFLYDDDCHWAQRAEAVCTSDMVIYSDFEGYSAHFKTGPDFGCIHFKGKGGE